MKALNWVWLWLVILLHGAIIIGNTVAFFILPFLTPWYVACPLMSFIGRLAVTATPPCPLLVLENSLRRKLGKKRIGGYIGHYFIKPIKIALGIKRRRKPNETAAGTVYHDSDGWVLRADKSSEHS